MAEVQARESRREWRRVLRGNPRSRSRRASDMARSRRKRARTAEDQHVQASVPGAAQDDKVAQASAAVPSRALGRDAASASEEGATAAVACDSNVRRRRSIGSEIRLAGADTLSSAVQLKAGREDSSGARHAMAADLANVLHAVESGGHSKGSGPEACSRSVQMHQGGASTGHVDVLTIKAGGEDVDALKLRLLKVQALLHKSVIVVDAKRELELEALRLRALIVKRSLKRATSTRARQ